MLLKPFDFGIIILSFCAVAVSFFRAYSAPNAPGLVNVQSENGLWVFPLDQVEKMTVSGPLGDTVVEIGGGEARITSSPCANQTCVSAGRIRAPGQWTACLPNRIMLYIDEGQSNNDVDAAAW